MSAASPAQPQVRRNAAAAPSRPQQAVHQQAAAPRTGTPQREVTQVFDFSKPRGDDEIRLHVADIPVLPTTLDADVFAPTLLSRVMDLFGPRR